MERLDMEEERNELPDRDEDGGEGEADEGEREALDGHDGPRGLRGRPPGQELNLLPFNVYKGVCVRVSWSLIEFDEGNAWERLCDT